MSDRILISMRHGRDLIVCKKAEQREILFLKHVQWNDEGGEGTTGSGF